MHPLSQWNPVSAVSLQLNFFASKAFKGIVEEGTSVSVQSYSVQCKGYNLVGITTVEEGTARGTTTLVYLQLHISLYTNTVHVLSRVVGVHPVL